MLIGELPMRFRICTARSNVGQTSALEDGLKILKLWQAVTLLAAMPCAAMAAPAGFTVSTPWMRYLLPNIPAGGYMVLKNASDADVVVTGASSPACGMLMLHKSDESSGMAVMADVQSVAVPAHGSVDFASGGYHLMCMQPKMQVGGRVEVTLKFFGGGSMKVVVPVYGVAGAP